MSEFFVADDPEHAYHVVAYLGGSDALDLQNFWDHLEWWFNAENSS